MKATYTIATSDGYARCSLCRRQVLSGRGYFKVQPPSSAAYNLCNNCCPDSQKIDELLTLPRREGK